MRFTDNSHKAEGKGNTVCWNSERKARINGIKSTGETHEKEGEEKMNQKREIGKKKLTGKDKDLGLFLQKKMHLFQEDEKPFNNGGKQRRGKKTLKYKLYLL